MESEQFWSRLEQEFTELGNLPLGWDLTASFNDEDLAALAADKRRAMSEAEGTEAVPAERRESWLASIQQIEEEVERRRGLVGFWMLYGGPKEDEGYRFRARFESLVIRAAIGANLDASTTERAVQSWLWLLRKHRESQGKWDGLWIKCLCEECAVVCHQLATDAYKRAAADESTSAPAVEQRPQSAPSETTPVRARKPFCVGLEHLRQMEGWTYDELGEIISVSKQKANLYCRDTEPTVGNRKDIADKLAKKLNRRITVPEIIELGRTDLQRTGQ